MNFGQKDGYQSVWISKATKIEFKATRHYRLQDATLIATARMCFMQSKLYHLSYSKKRYKMIRLPEKRDVFEVYHKTYYEKDTDCFSFDILKGDTLMFELR